MAQRVTQLHEIKYIEKQLLVQKRHPEAVIPERDHPANAGWDVTLIQRTDGRVEDTHGDFNTYSTGLCFVPPIGYVVQVVGHDDLINQGYFLAQPRILDPDNHEEIVVALYKVRPGPDLDLPYRGIRVMLVPAVYSHLSAITDDAETADAELLFSSMHRGAPRAEVSLDSIKASPVAKAGRRPPASHARSMLGGGAAGSRPRSNFQ